MSEGLTWDHPEADPVGDVKAFIAACARVGLTGRIGMGPKVRQLYVQAIEREVGRVARRAGTRPWMLGMGLRPVAIKPSRHGRRPRR